ncbi:MAG TPA: NAD(P)H-binding protein [Vicinamibacteria bacterium]|nr:NAD(P)H-binding protein [Vicinamibacteria bacterium]
MRIVVTGGTGFIGREVVKRLLDTPGDEIVVTTRDPEAAPTFGGRVSLVQAFAGDALSLGKAFTGADVVVHAIQFPNHPVERPRNGQSYLEVDGRGTQVAASVAKRVGVRRFVYLSGAGAGQGRPQSWFRAKDMAEAAIRETGLEHALVRPSWIYGPNDRSMNRFVTFCRYLPVIPVIGDGKTTVYPIFVGDVARAVAEAARREDCKDKALDLAGPDRLSMDDIIRCIQKVLGKRRPLLHQPAGLMKLLVLPMALLPEPMLSPGAIDFVLQEVPMDPKPAQDYFGFAFKRLEEGLRTYL